MKSILMSIQPKWCELIASGKKTIEVRKTAPKEVPFRAFIYCTNGFMLRDNLRCGVESIQEDVKSGKLKRFVLSAEKSNNVICSSYPFVNRKIIGEFVCDKVDKVINHGSGFSIFNESKAYTNCVAKQSGLYFDDLKKYLGTKDGYAWHITDLKIYDKPKALGEFRTRLSDTDIRCKYRKKCSNLYSDKQKNLCTKINDGYKRECDFNRLGWQTDCSEYEPMGKERPITRPPKSWQYVAKRLGRLPSYEELIKRIPKSGRPRKYGK